MGTRNGRLTIVIQAHVKNPKERNRFNNAGTALALVASESLRLDARGQPFLLNVSVS